MGKLLHLAFVDFKKAFNFVNYNVLFDKLIKSGMSGHFEKTLRNMYSKIGAFTNVNNKMYEWIENHCGIN